MANLRRKIALFFDISFVLLLCFAVLFGTMMISRKFPPVSDGLYVDYMMLAAVTCAIFLYLAFVVRISIRETQAMTELYKADAQGNSLQKRIGRS